MRGWIWTEHGPWKVVRVPIFNALALGLKRQYRRVHEDVTILERAGLLDRSFGDVRTTADVLTAQVVLGS